MDQKAHWTAAYQNKNIEELGWYEKTPQPSLNIIRKLKLSHYAEILIVGSGATTLIDFLLEEGFQNITVNDISPTALDLLRSQLGKEECNIEWVLDDLTSPTLLKELPLLDLWHDRAVLHFFTQEKEQLAYFNLLRAKVKSKGYVILGQFAKDGALKCSGLPVFQYDEQMYKERLGSDFNLIETINYTFLNPKGEERPYIYSLFQRK
jgi:SAM-dependent methyltransferase